MSIEIKNFDDDMLSLQIVEYEKIVSSKNLDLLVQKAESQQDLPVFDAFLEITSENFGQWQQVKVEAKDSELDQATLQIVILEGTGFSLVAISDEPQINANTRYRIL